MAETIKGATLVGSASGSITKIISCTIAGMTTDDIAVHAADDTNGVGTHIPGKTTQGPMTVTFVKNPSITTTLAAKQVAADPTETWTYTDGGGNTWADTAFQTEGPGHDSDLDSPDTQSVTLQPQTKWTHTAP